MTDIIIHKHSITAGDAPEPAELNLGELAIQAADGHIYLKKTDGTVNRVTMLPGGTQQQVLYKTGAGDYALGWGTISSTLMGGALWSEVVAEVQRVFALVEGTASVLLSSSATLTAGSTGPITVSVADTDYLTDGTSITGVLGTVYGTLSRSGSTYSFESVQSYTGDINFATGTRFAAAFLNDTFNPLRIGSAEVQDDDSYTDGSGYARVEVDTAGRIAWGIRTDGSFDVPSGSINLDDAKVQEDVSFADGSGYARVEVDASGRIAWGIKNDGTVAIKKALFENESIFQSNSTFESDVTIKGDLLVQGETVAIEVTNLTIEDNTILLNKGESGNGVSLGSAGIEVDRGTADNVRFEWNEANQAWTAEESIKTNSSLFFNGSSSEEDLSYTDGSGYYQVVLDSSGRIGYGLKDDGTVQIEKGVNIADGGAIDGDLGYNDFYQLIEVDANGRICRAVTTDGSNYLPKVSAGSLSADTATIGTLNVSNFTSPAAVHGADGIFTVESVSGVSQIIKYNNGIKTQLTTVGANTAPSLTAETPVRVLFSSTRTGTQSYQVMNTDGSRLAHAIAPKNTVIWGDSMTNFLGTTPLENALGDGRRIVSIGYGGKNSVFIAQRQGGYLSTGTISGAQIPASGSVSVTGLAAPVDNKVPTFNCSVDGIAGTLNHNGGSPTFTRSSAGTALPVTNPVTFVPILNDVISAVTYHLCEYTSILWLGRNGVGGAPEDTDVSVYTGVINEIRNLSKRILILPIFNGGYSSESNGDPAIPTSGTSGYDTIMSRNASIAAAFPQYWYDVRRDFIDGAEAWLQANHSTAYALNWTRSFYQIGSGAVSGRPATANNGDIWDDSGTKTIYDTATSSWVAYGGSARVQAQANLGPDSAWDVANDVPPRALRADNIHLNAYGNEFLGGLIAAKLQSLGW